MRPVSSTSYPLPERGHSHAWNEAQSFSCTPAARCRNPDCHAGDFVDSADRQRQHPNLKMKHAVPFLLPTRRLFRTV